jgi:hypothetical protein
MAGVRRVAAGDGPAADFDEVRRLQLLDDILSTEWMSTPTAAASRVP